MPGLSTPESAELRRLAGDPEAQAAYAATLLTPKAAQATLHAALGVLRDVPFPAARSALRELYEHLDKDGPRRDSGAYVRRLILAALRPIVIPADAPLLLRAVTTVERMPPSFEDEAGPLRATALITLNEVDPELAAFHATRLLADVHADRMSGEPCLTAARVLASQENLLPLYAYAMQEGSSALPEVMGECLRSLTAIPLPLLPGLIERHSKGQDTVVLIGLCDLLIKHERGPQGPDYLGELLATTQDPDLVRYLTIALLAGRDEALRDLALSVARLETRPAHLAALRDALEPFAGDRTVAAALDRLERRS